MGVPDYFMSRVSFQNSITKSEFVDIMNDKRYPDWGIVSYRFPSTSTYPFIQLLKRDGIWRTLVWRAPERTQPRATEHHASVLLQHVLVAMEYENVHPREMEIIGTGPSVHRLFVRVD